MTVEETIVADFTGSPHHGIIRFIPIRYQTNLGVITALMSPLKVGPYDFFRRRSVILSDELNHASIVDGAKASKQKVVVYKHCDMDDLEKKLKKFKHRRKLVVTDGVFSMEGDIAPLDKIATLCKKYNSLLPWTS